MRHSDRVLASVESRQSAAKSRIAASWRRSFERYGLSPASRPELYVSTAADMTMRREKSARLLEVAAPRLDRLFGLVGASGCTVVLTDAEGVILDQRSSEADATDFADWGLRKGAHWNEAQEGTNGIGTCLVEKRPITVHRDQHYFSKNIAMTCIGTPIYGSRGELIGVLDVSSARLDQSDAMNTLISATVGDTAQQIETENFRACFASERVVLAGQSTTDQSALVAINSDDCIIGATRAARRLFEWDLEQDLKPVAATDIFNEGQDYRGFDRGEKAALVKAITRAEGNLSTAAKSLGIGRATLYRRMNRLGIKREN